MCALGRSDLCSDSLTHGLGLGFHSESRQTPVHVHGLITKKQNLKVYLIQYYLFYVCNEKTVRPGIGLHRVLAERSTGCARPNSRKLLMKQY